MRGWLPRLILLPLLAAGGLVAAGVGWQTIAVARDAVRFPPPGQMVAIGKRRLHLRCVGTGSPTVLILSGSGTPAVTSFGMQDRLAPLTRVCSYDRAGLGWSDPAPAPMGLAAMTDDLQALLQRARVPAPYILVPESFGGMVALDLARRIPDQIAGGVFVDSSEPALWGAITGVTLPATRARNRWTQLAWATGVGRLAFGVLKPAWVDTLPDRTRDQFRAVFSRAMPGYGEIVGAYELTPAPARPRVVAGAWGDKPLIVLVHDRVSDMLSPEFEAGWPQAQRRLATLSTGSRLVAAPAGHAIAGENPGIVVTAVREVVAAARRDAESRTTARR